MKIWKLVAAFLIGLALGSGGTYELAPNRFDPHSMEAVIHDGLQGYIRGNEMREDWAKRVLSRAIATVDHDAEVTLTEAWDALTFGCETADSCLDDRRMRDILTIIAASAEGRIPLDEKFRLGDLLETAAAYLGESE